MTLSTAKYVLFRDDTIGEIYLAGFVGENDIAHTSDVSEAVGFPTARAAYDFAAESGPRFDWWKVGLRS